MHHTRYKDVLWFFSPGVLEDAFAISYSINTRSPARALVCRAGIGAGGHDGWSSSRECLRLEWRRRMGLRLGFRFLAVHKRSRLFQILLEQPPQRMELASLLEGLGQQLWLIAVEFWFGLEFGLGLDNNYNAHG